MNIVEIIFSPTGDTEKVAHIISKQWSENTIKIDLSNSKADFSGCAINKEDRILIAMPSFGGRAPAVAIERLKKIAGNGAKCTLVCVYGNRAYEDTLAEMEEKNAVSKLLRLSLLLHSIPSSRSMPQTDRMRPMRNSWPSLHVRLQTRQNQQLLFRTTVRTKKPAVRD